MKGKQLRKAVLLGMAMSMAVWTTGMAAQTITKSRAAGHGHEHGRLDDGHGGNIA